MGRQAGMRFGFVVLHYLVDDATRACVESIRRHCAGSDYRIVVVDNDSANGSWERLCAHYRDAEDVTLVHNDANEGFARGNNVGYRVCRERLGCGFITCMNNDAQIDCDDFMALCEEDWREDGCAVIGPDIISGKDGSHQNPVRSVYDSRAKVEAMRTHIKRNLFLLRWHLMGPYQGVKRLMKRAPAAKAPRQAGTSAPSVPPAGTYKLHGSCLVFTPAFTERFDEPFDPGTFLYLEEDILYMRCRQAGLAMRYDPRIRVRHAEDVSTDSMVRHDERRKQIQYLERHRQSAAVLERYLGR